MEEIGEILVNNGGIKGDRDKWIGERREREIGVGKLKIIV